MAFSSWKNDLGVTQDTHSKLTIFGYIATPLLVMALFLISIFGVFIPRVEQNYILNRQRLVRDVLDTTWNHLTSLHQRNLSGELTLDQAQKKAITYYSQLRYGDDNKDYFWIITTESDMVMHPYQTQYMGKNLADYQDQDGRYVLPEMAKIARTKGRGFINYHWQWKDDPTRVDRKISYVRLFKPWGWVLGTGVYVDDIERDIRQEVFYIIWVSVGIFICLCFALGYILYRWYSVDKRVRMTQYELADQKEHYRALFESSGDALVLLSPERIILDCNQKAMDMFGVDTKAEILGLDIAVVSEKDQGNGHFADDLADEFSRKALAQGGVKFEWIHKQILGRRFPAEITLAGIPGVKTSRLIAIIRDISERKEVERTIRESEERFRKLFELNRDGLAVVHPDGNIIDFNPSFQTMVGYRREELLRMSMYDFLPEKPGESLEKGVIQRNFGMTIEREYMRKNGDVFPAEITAYKAPLSNMTVIWVSTRDVTQRKRAERTLRESEFRFRTFFNSNPEGVVLMDFDGKIQDCNKALLEMSGYDHDGIVGQTFEQFIPDQFHQASSQALRSIMAGVADDGSPEMSFIKKNGEKLPISIKGWQITDEQSHPVLLGVFIRDMTEKKNLSDEKAALQKQLMQTQRMEAIGTLAGGIAHDFNNILSGIIGFTELAMTRESKNRESKTYGYLTRVLEAGNRAKELVRQILTFSRREEIGLQAVQVIPLIKECVKLLESTFPASISISLDLGAPNDTITADPTQIHQIIMNICTNAYHAMRKDGGQLGISIENMSFDKPRESLSLQAMPGDYLRFTVTDTGQGMSPQILERIFEPYFTTKEVNEGTGLGLSVILGIIRGLHGLIDVQSEPGQGTRFDIYFPVSGSKASKQPLVQSGLPVGNGERVLIVDDEPFFLDIVRENLEQLGYQVHAESDSTKALEMIRKAPDRFDLMITDQTMPGLTGVQLSEKARQAAPNLSIILCTGYSDTLTDENIVYHGISKLLLKPVNMRSLARVVRRVLQNAPNV